MLRWSSDVIFLRVICVCLIAVTFIFALILTNVFIDIDRFLMFKTLNKQENVGRIDNEAKDNLYNKNSRDKSIIYRSKRSSIDPSKGSLKLIYKEKNITNNEKNNSGNAVDLLQILQNEADLEINKSLGENTTTRKTLVKRQVNYGEGTTTKTINNNANATMKGNRHIDVEIKTHFNSKTTDAGRKQFISHLIDKIRQALRSDTEMISNQIENEPHFKTREQDPIVVAKNVIFDSRNIPQVDKRGKIDIQYKKPKFKHVKTAGRNTKYVEDFQNSLGRRLQKPIADNAEIDHINSKLYPSYNSLSLLPNNIVGAGYSDYDKHMHSPSVQKSRYNELDDVIKVYHDTITSM